MAVWRDFVKTSSARWCLPASASQGGRCSLSLNPPPNRPDPAIFDQEKQLAAGLTTTWNNPDITWFAPPTYVAGRWQPGPTDNKLLDNAKISIHNLSATTPAINAVVTVSRSRFGIGLSRSSLSTQLVSIPAGQSTDLVSQLGLTPIEMARGGEALFVDISHPYDADISNNHGASVVSFQFAGDSMSIPISNQTNDPQTYTLALMPNGVAAQLEDAQLQLAPGDSGFVGIRFTVPAASPFSDSVTVFARNSRGDLVGGATVNLYF